MLLLLFPTGLALTASWRRSTVVSTVNPTSTVTSYYNAGASPPPEKRDVHAAAKAAEEATEATKHMKASLGRTVYVGGEEEWVGKITDPGAYGLKEFFNGLASAL